MSRVGKVPIKISSDIKVSLQKDRLVVEGAKGRLELSLSSEISILQEDGVLRVQNRLKTKRSIAFQGLFRSLIANMVQGVTEGFSKKLEIVGVGYRVQAQGQRLNFTIGKSHPVFFDVPQTLSVKVTDPTHFEIFGIDKQLVGQVVADIRSLYPPEPYKGKGIRYENEDIRLKEGKSAS